jgi:hypothetical protein
VNAANMLIDAVRRVEFGPLTTFRNLGLLALSTAGEREADYLTLDEALERPPCALSKSVKEATFRS